MIDKRVYKRYSVTLRAQVVSGGKYFDGIIANVSEEGLAYVMTTFIDASGGFVPRNGIELIFMIQGGVKFTLRCDVRWFLKPSDDKKGFIVGMKIIDPPEEYREWVRTLKSVHSGA